MSPPGLISRLPHRYHIPHRSGSASEKPESLPLPETHRCKPRSLHTRHNKRRSDISTPFQAHTGKSKGMLPTEPDPDNGRGSKHTAIFHIVAVYNGVWIREILLVMPVRKDTAAAVVLPGKQMMQIISIIGSLYHRITDGKAGNINPAITSGFTACSPSKSICRYPSGSISVLSGSDVSSGSSTNEASSS